MKKLFIALAIAIATINVYGQRQINVSVNVNKGIKVETKSDVEYKDTVVERIYTRYIWKDTIIHKIPCHKDTLIKTRVSKVVRYVNINGFARTKVYFEDGTSRIWDPDKGGIWFKVGQSVEYADEIFTTCFDTVIKERYCLVVKQGNKTKFYDKYGNVDTMSMYLIPSKARSITKIDSVKTVKTIYKEYNDTTDVFTYSKTDLIVISVKSNVIYSNWYWFTDLNKYVYKMRVYSEQTKRCYTVKITKELYDKYSKMDSQYTVNTKKECIERGIRLTYNDLAHILPNENYIIKVKKNITNFDF